MAGQSYVLLPIAAVRVKGKNRSVRVFAPLCRQSETERSLCECVDEYGLALSAFETGRFQDASERWRTLAHRAWPGAEVAAAMRAEALRLARQPPPDGWGGILEIGSK